MKPALSEADWTRGVPDEDSVAILAASFARLIKAAELSVATAL